MKAMLLGMLAETSIHPGSGQDTGFVDLPVAREATTDYPVIAGSSMKGALLSRGRAAKLEGCDRIFGQQEVAGQLLVGDARLLLLPVRSLQGSFKWVTCPHLLERFGRDCARSGDKGVAVSNVTVNEGQCLAQSRGDLFLEERQFHVSDEIPSDVVESLMPLIPAIKARLKDRLVLLHDDEFAWFARYGLAVNARNVLDEEKKSSKNLWYEETIPPDAVFYCLLAEREDSGVLEAIQGLFQDYSYLQVGGNETVGQGWFAVNSVSTNPIGSGGGA
ncbi:MAG: type III-B CRISPR module RAMP protein Cmr4 [Pirellulaceae bacterium]|nr:type III-B CRISPR module RAMP protein Cmr4 [Pirellulaceae bacterium]